MFFLLAIVLFIMFIVTAIMFTKKQDNNLALCSAALFTTAVILILTHLSVLLTARATKAQLMHRIEVNYKTDTMLMHDIQDYNLKYPMLLLQEPILFDERRYDYD